MAEGRISLMSFYLVWAIKASITIQAINAQGQIWITLGQRKWVSSQSLPSE